MKYRLETDKGPEPLVDIRLMRTTQPDGISLQAKKGNGNIWATILTLTEETGMLALHDINTKVLSDMGFDMQGDRNRLNYHGGHISLLIA